MSEELEEGVHEAREDVDDLGKEGVGADIASQGAKMECGFEDRSVCGCVGW